MWQFFSNMKIIQHFPVTYLLCPTPIQHELPTETGINRQRHNLSGMLLEKFDRLEFGPELDKVHPTQILAALIQRACNSNGTIKIHISR